MASIAGQLVPGSTGAKARLSYFDGKKNQNRETDVNSNGYFMFNNLPKDTIYDLSVAVEGKSYAPTIGRIFELGSESKFLKIIVTPDASFNPEKRRWSGESSEGTFGTVYKPFSLLESGGLEAAPQNFQVTHQISSLGLFDRDRRIQNVDRKQRIALFGTCVFEGQQVSRGERVNLQLEHEIFLRTGKRVEVPNLSFSSYKTIDLDRLIDQAIVPMGARVVVASFSQGLELMFNYWKIESQRLGLDIDHPNSRTLVFDSRGNVRKLEKSADWLAYQEKPQLLANDDGYNIFLGVNWLKELCREDRKYSPLMHEAIENYVRLLKHLKRRLETRGIRLVFALTTEIEIMNFSTEWEENNILYGTKYYARNVKEIFDRAGINLIILSESFAKKPNPKTAHWINDTHWSRDGHAWGAEAIADYLIRNKLID